MTYPVVPDVPQGNMAVSDPTTTTQKVNIKAANTSPALADDAMVAVISPNNSGLPVNLPVIVQQAHAVSSADTQTQAKAFTSNNVAGNSIIVVCGAGNNGALTVTDTLSNTYTKATLIANSTTFEAGIYYATNIAAGANTVTVTNAGAAASMAIQIYEVSGLIALSSSILDQTATGTGTSATATTTVLGIDSPNEYAFAGVAVGTAAQAVSATSGTRWTLDSTQNSGGTPTGMFTFGALSQVLGSITPLFPQATLASSEPFAMAVATFRPVVLGVEGTVNTLPPYPAVATAITADSGNVAAATATATLAGATGKTTYISGFMVTASGATAASVVTGTVTGVITGTLHFTFVAPAGVTAVCTPLVVTFPYPIPASATNTAIAVALPSLGSGNTNATVSAFGYQI